ncbi:multicomponent Na+:H+ antiporter subunit E [Marinospirillum celere]|uniref:Multicomponent Na+:H+ antiporter subunit E n=1 Tax=Marinospirillum celere TaxID=1122252 RepID=A0A1I1EGW4_9GAMM|nr:Na+/H+ antiporter subunit E [Marinospirillum celere]SFB86257.1 multicomponent Na+:H+ antiporter subunit E [Marinospirillum celere]
MRWWPRPGFLLRSLLLALVWWIISQGQANSWWWGLPAVLLVAWITPVLPSSQPWRWRLLPFLRILPRFLLLSARGGWEVARLALSPHQALNSRLIDYTWSCLPPGPAQLFMASLINLIPGTLTLRFLPDQDCLHVHLLHFQPSTLNQLLRLEVDVADLYGVPVSPAVRSRL